VISAESKAADVDYVVVVTLQRGDPPPVTVSGKSPGGVATVGSRTVRCVRGTIEIA